jgi:sugar-specific transcriptional regulator TrmB
MQTLTYEQHLIQAGLTTEQARVYEALIQNGLSPASIAAKKAGISRTLTYKVLGELAELGLVEKREDSGKVARFIAAHPLKLKELIEKRQQDAKDSLSALEGVLGAMTSEYNIAGGKPGIEFFEGMDGIAAVLNDTLSAKEVIYTYADLKAIDDVYRDLNKEYLEKRKRRGIEKKGILADTPFTRTMLASYDTSVTDSRLIRYAEEPSKTVIQMYDGKTSYIVMDRAEPVSMIVHDANITAAHRAIFLALWNHAIPFSASSAESGSTESLSKTA